MNMFKKLVSLTLCVFVALGAVACGSACLWAGTLAVCVWQYLGVAGNLRGRRGERREWHVS